MRMYVNWRTALKAVLSNRKRSILTMVGIVIGIASVISILSLGRGFEKQMKEKLTKSESGEVVVQVNFEPIDNSLWETNEPFFERSDIERLQGVPGVRRVKEKTDEEEMFQKSFRIKGKEVVESIELVSSSTTKVDVGRNLSAQDGKLLNKIVTIDSTLAENLYGGSEEALGKGIEVNGEWFRIVGIYPGKNEEVIDLFSLPSANLEIPKQTYQHYFTQKVSAIELVLEEGVRASETSKKALTELKENGSLRERGKYRMVDTAAASKTIGGILQIVTFFVAAVAGISLFIAGVGVMNMMYISVSERTREIGIRRALGATRSSIRLQFLLEGVTLTLFGGIIGLLLGIGLAFLIGSPMKVAPSIDFLVISLAVGVSTGIGLIFSVMPAASAARKDLIDILR